jgi:hypothetical protein
MDTSMFYRYSELAKNSTFGNEVDPQGRRDKLTLVGAVVPCLVY